ncbi:hypothetical protein [Williamsia sterculiae]|uniref:Mce-associated membrane protein n=1 Tax=Williamsia sterculiae TaxID=1344003 RepID=A0A1N7GQC8_9NOCA|nr:hypothetical protein [Williamsia sterculiae]SIS14749.1 hypothetical protein SAMN05445060_2989 [Williamsia sterculiae]
MRRWVVAAGVVSTVGLVVVVVVLSVLGNRADGRSHRADDALRAVRAGVTTLLTSDPGAPQRYVDTALSVTAGELHQRISSSRSEVVAAVAAQRQPSTGAVLTAALTSADDAGDVETLVVAAASDPELLGGTPGRARLVLSVTVSPVGGSWKIERAQAR